MWFWECSLKRRSRKCCLNWRRRCHSDRGLWYHVGKLNLYSCILFVPLNKCISYITGHYFLLYIYMIWYRNYGDHDINGMKNYSKGSLNRVMCAEDLSRISALEWNRCIYFHISSNPICRYLSVKKYHFYFYFLSQDTLLLIIQVTFEPAISTGSPRINPHAGSF